MFRFRMQKLACGIFNKQTNDSGWRKGISLGEKLFTQCNIRGLKVSLSEFFENLISLEVNI